MQKQYPHLVDTVFLTYLLRKIRYKPHHMKNQYTRIQCNNNPQGQLDFTSESYKSFFQYEDAQYETESQLNK